MPQEPVLRYHLGMAYLKNGQKELAKEHIREALKANKPFPGREDAEKAVTSLSQGK
jgi:Tfp pilus assembly protein PilF